MKHSLPSKYTSHLFVKANLEHNDFISFRSNNVTYAASIELKNDIVFENHLIGTGKIQVLLIKHAQTACFDI